MHDSARGSTSCVSRAVRLAPALRLVGIVGKLPGVDRLALRRRIHARQPEDSLMLMLTGRRPVPDVWPAWMECRHFNRDLQPLSRLQVDRPCAGAKCPGFRIEPTVYKRDITLAHSSAAYGAHLCLQSHIGCAGEDQLIPSPRSRSAMALAAVACPAGVQWISCWK